VRHVSAEDRAVEEELKEQVRAMYYGRDSYVWTEQINKKGFVQHSTQPAGLETIMLKARTTMKCNMYHLRQVACNMRLRRQWETILYDMSCMDETSDGNWMKTYYSYRCPRVGFLGI